MLILNPNPCIDITMWVKKLTPGAVHRAFDNETTAGGKGINVARACKTMGLSPLLFLMLPILEGDFYKELLDSEEHDVQYFRVKGEVRKAIIINEEKSSAITVLNGLGPEITNENWNAYCISAAEKTKVDEIVLLMGSLPNNHPKNALDHLIKTIAKTGNKLLIDTSPASFKSQRNELIDFIAPNLEEAEAIINETPADLFVSNDGYIKERSLAAASALFNKMGKNVIVTSGAYGCAFKNQEEHWWEPAFTVKPNKYKSAVGAGDSFVAGFAIYYEANQKNVTGINWREAIKFGMATAAASCETYRAGGLDKARALAFFAEGNRE